MNKLEKLMKEDGWILGYSVNYGVKYWAFRKNGFEIELDNITEYNKDEIGNLEFESWSKN